MEEVKFTRQELYDLVWATPLLTLSKKYVISDNGIRKICKRMNIPLPNLGYWQKGPYRRKLLYKKLPKGNTGQNEITLRIRGEGDDIKENGLYSVKWLEEEIKSKSNLPLRVPKRLSNPDRFINLAKDYLTNDKYGISGGVACTRRGQLNIRVAAKNIGRALRLMDALIKLLRARGHDIYVGERKTYVKMFEEDIEIYLKEKFEASEIKDRWGTRIIKPTGILAFIYGDLYKKEIKDGKERLEDKMANVLARLELEGKREHDKRLEIKRYWDLQREKERIIQEAKERKEKELKDFKDLLYQANQWEHAKVLRSFLREIEINSREELSEERESWLIWAKQKADWFDPIVNSHDSFLTDNDKRKVLSILQGFN